MRKLFLCGRSEAGKTTLTQALKGEPAHYVKTQYVKTWDITIDTPGEYAETKTLAMALGIFSFDSDVVGLLCGADEPYNLFDPAINGVPAAIVANNTPDVAAVSGATVTSNAIMDAVTLCLEQAAQ